MSVESAGIRVKPTNRFYQWAQRVSLGRKLVIALMIAAFGMAVLTFAVLSGWAPFGTSVKSVRRVLILLNIDLVLFLILGAIVARRLVQLWMERRRGAVGSRLHTRLVVLFSLVAVTPTIIVSVSSAVIFSFGIQTWFSDRVRTALSESNAVAQAYLKEHQQTIRGDILAMARDAARLAPVAANDGKRFQRFISAQGAIRALSEAVVFDSSGRTLARWNEIGFSLFDEPVPIWALDRARRGETVILKAEAEDRVRALIKLEPYVDLFLYVTRFIDHRVLGHIERTRSAVSEYEELEGQRSSIEITFAMVFIFVALLLLLSAIWVGLTFATRLARPISELVNAAEQVREGDLSARVNEGAGADEVGTLSRAFNRMAEQLNVQRDHLVEANRQLDDRRHFMETVLAGVSSGVIGLDGNGKIKVVNSAAADLSSTKAEEAIGRRLDEMVPESADLLTEALSYRSQPVNGQIELRNGNKRQTVLVRISPQEGADTEQDYVVTFDDITELLSAQRKAAWSDVARRIAHEIKNPLTPIQLAAERLRRKYQQEIASDPETFVNCTDTIIRQVGDIGRLVDEFSAFARMPSPVMKEENISAICRDSVVLFENAHREISFRCNFGAEPVLVSCDARQIGQALTNLLQNAVDAIEGNARSTEESKFVELAIDAYSEKIVVTVRDNGKGLPTDDQRDRLTEPYVTTRDKGTGLGLAIVRKIMEDHGGELKLEDHPDGGAKVSLVFLLTTDKNLAAPEISKLSIDEDDNGL
ncbi:MAG: two-component sensor histidine kinase [Rhodospirillaceae bacterium]|nr:two-component sensor histidine kinase [Rhodospirillaceae bacterium]|tara:strand:- start:16151 stop:18427 length:2277 start_codon:yes stop_codon:yes gene_type:complete